VTATDAVLKARLHEELIERLGARLGDAEVSAEQLGPLVGRELEQLIAMAGLSLDTDERRRLTVELMDDVVGLGPLESLLADRSVDEIMVNGFDEVYVERRGRLEHTGVTFTSEAHLRRVIDRIVARVGRRVDESSPMVDARLPDGSRVNAIVPPLAVDGAALTIRKFAVDPFQVDDLITMGAFTAEVAELLRAVVAEGLNIVVTGGTGTGKTTLLNVISGFIPDGERIVTIEDAVELQLRQPHVVRLESRPPNLEGSGQVTVRDLVRNALRMRPDRIIVGEVRGAEALDMLQAMNTGHDGSISTVHCNSPRDALSRLETMVLMAGLDLPSRAIRDQISSALDLIVHVQRFRDGHRGISHITEVLGLEGDVITTSDIMVLDRSRPDERRLVPTGVPASFSARVGWRP
jgi:pilus assembly protein CpaF